MSCQEARCEQNQRSRTSITCTVEKPLNPAFRQEIIGVEDTTYSRTSILHFVGSMMLKRQSKQYAKGFEIEFRKGFDRTRRENHSTLQSQKQKLAQQKPKHYNSAAMPGTKQSSPSRNLPTSISASRKTQILRTSRLKIVSRWFVAPTWCQATKNSTIELPKATTRVFHRKVMNLTPVPHRRRSSTTTPNVRADSCRKFQKKTDGILTRTPSCVAAPLFRQMSASSSSQVLADCQNIALVHRKPR